MRCVLLLTLAFFALAAHGEDTKNTLEIYIRKTLENFRKKMKTGIPEINMPVLDPLHIPIIDIKIKEGIADVKLKIDNLMCQELSTFNIKTINVDMATMKLSAVVVLPKGIAQAAQYDLNGLLLGFIPLYGKGKAAFAINDLEITIDTKLDISTGKLQLQDFAIKLQFSQIQVYLENILGGGNLGDVINTVINSFGKAIFDSQKGHIEWSLKHVIRNALNTELAKIDLGKIGKIGYDSIDVKSLYDTATANAEIDTLIQNVRPNLVAIDTVTLQNAKLNFNRGMLRGYAEVTDGTVTGLSTIAREGDAKAATNPVTGQSGTAAFLSVTNLPVSFQSTLVLLPLFKETPQITGTVPLAKVLVMISTDAAGQKQLTQFRLVGLTVPQLTVTNVGQLGLLVPILRGLAAKQTLLGVKTAIETEVRGIIAEGLA